MTTTYSDLEGTCEAADAGDRLAALAVLDMIEESTSAEFLVGTYDPKGLAAATRASVAEERRWRGTALVACGLRTGKRDVVRCGLAIRLHGLGVGRIDAEALWTIHGGIYQIGYNFAPLFLSGRFHRKGSRPADHHWVGETFDGQRMVASATRSWLDTWPESDPTTREDVLPPGRFPESIENPVHPWLATTQVNFLEIFAGYNRVYPDVVRNEATWTREFEYLERTLGRAVLEHDRTAWLTAEVRQ